MQLMHNWHTSKPELVFNTYNELLKYCELLLNFLDKEPTQKEREELSMHVFHMLSEVSARAEIFSDIKNSLGIDI